MDNFRATHVRRASLRNSKHHSIGKQALSAETELLDTLLIDLLVACHAVAKSKKMVTITPAIVEYVIRHDNDYKRLFPGFAVKSFKHNHAGRKKTKLTTEQSG